MGLDPRAVAVQGGTDDVLGFGFAHEIVGYRIPDLERERSNHTTTMTIMINHHDDE